MTNCYHDLPFFPKQQLREVKGIQVSTHDNFFSLNKGFFKHLFYLIKNVCQKIAFQNFEKLITLPVQCSAKCVRLSATLHGRSHAAWLQTAVCIATACRLHGRHTHTHTHTHRSCTLTDRAGHFRYFWIFSIKKIIFCIFYQVNLTGSGLFK